MTNTTLDDNISDLERHISSASDTERAKVAERLRALLTPQEPIKYHSANQKYSSASQKRYSAEQDDDLFDNMPI